MKTVSSVSIQGYTFNINAKFSLKSIFATLLVVFAFSCGIAQPITIAPQLSTKYRNMEIRAPKHIKTVLKAQRLELVHKQLTFQVGFTEVSGLNIGQLAGETEIPAYVNRQLTANLARRPFLPDFDLSSNYCSANMTKFDARSQGIITPIRRQQCGNCWSYAAVAMFETNYLKTNGGNVNSIDASEQHVVNCSNGGHCRGGISYKVFDWMIDNNKSLATEAQYPDAGIKGNCPVQQPNTSYYAEQWGSCRRDGNNSLIASVSNIKAAICKYGAVKTSFWATNLVQNYTNGVINEFRSNYGSPSSNHAVLIVGWDDTKNAWLIKNSWGVLWGDNGYGWIDYGSNNIGRRAIWVKAKKINPRVNPALVGNNPAIISTNTPIYIPQNVNPVLIDTDPILHIWNNKDKNTRGMTKLILSNKGKTVQAFGSCSPRDCDWGKSSVRPFRGRDYESYAIFSSRIGTKKVYWIHKKGILLVKTVATYKDRRKSKTSYYTFIQRTK